MKVTNTQFTISEIYKWLKDKSLIVKKEYQRDGRLWPSNARSYFIDTILNDYPFPKITMRQSIDLRTKSPIKELVDGQQRVLSIVDYINNKFSLTSSSINFSANKFSDLDDDTQTRFLNYYISVDLITAVSDEEVFEIFRRMNSYTLPLNEAEKRHAKYQGEFKWFIRDMMTKYSPLFETYNIITKRNLTRMQDADLLTELVQVLESGLINKSNPKLNELYKNYNDTFDNRRIIEEKLTETLDYVFGELVGVCENKQLSHYLLYSLFGALVYNNWGLVSIAPGGVSDCITLGQYTPNIDGAVRSISELLYALEVKEEDGQYSEFVKACSSSTHRIKSRMLRLKWFVLALQNKL
jgi:hypothetical protein